MHYPSRHQHFPWGSAGGDHRIPLAAMAFPAGEQIWKGVSNIGRPPPTNWYLSQPLPPPSVIEKSTLSISIFLPAVSTFRTPDADRKAQPLSWTSLQPSLERQSRWLAYSPTAFSHFSSHFYMLHCCDGTQRHWRAWTDEFRFDQKKPIP